MLSSRIKTALRFEADRKRFLAVGNTQAVLNTYQTQKSFLPDTNTASFWDAKFASPEAAEVFPMEEWRLQTVINLLDCRHSILNLGVGRGVLEERLLNKCPQPTYLGTDITNQTIRQLRKKFPELEFRRAKLGALSPRQRQFDQVLLLEVLEHIKPNQTFAVLNKVYSLVKKGGRAIISVPVNEGLAEMLPENPNSHMRLYSEALLRFELETVGFTIETIYRASAFATWFWPKHWLNQWLHFRQPNNLVVVCRKKLCLNKVIRIW